MDAALFPPLPNIRSVKRRADVLVHPHLHRSLSAKNQSAVKCPRRSTIANLALIAVAPLHLLLPLLTPLALLTNTLAPSPVLAINQFALAAHLITVRKTINGLKGVK